MTDEHQPVIRPTVDAMPFARMCGVELDEATPARVSSRVVWAAERCTAGGVLHGGLIMTLADSLGALCAVLNLPAGARTSTIESRRPDLTREILS
jgi:1,4-dihydroxy-2-naphthoyl-CoA hydrolase